MTGVSNNDILHRNHDGGIGLCAIINPDFWFELEMKAQAILQVVAVKLSAIIFFGA